MYVKIQK